jgi:uncharacterized membrane protein YsdA (DUF1294 family)
MTIQNYVIAAFALSVISFGMYGWDKRQAKVNGWRVPEKNLHLLSLLGGWPGALMGQKVFRHKTQKQSFRVAFWFTVLCHVGVVTAIWFGYIK